MRIFSIITAILVMATLYLLVFERERVIQFAAGTESAQSSQATADSTAEPGDNTTTADGSAPDDATDSEDLISVVVQTSTADDIANAVLVRGRTEAARQVQVRSETSGKVVSVPRPKGTTVTQGEILCQLDPGTREISLLEAEARLTQALARLPEAKAGLPAARARLAEAEARLAEAELNLRAAERLSEDGFASETRLATARAGFESARAAVETARSGVASSESAVEAARAGVQSAQAGVAAAKREIARLKIAAPFAGLLESDSAETGTLLQPGALCATVIQLDPIKLVGFVPEIDVARVKTGVPAGGRLATGKEIAGQVTFVSRSADPVTRTFRVEIEVPNPGGAIRDGQTAEILISSDGTAAHLLPLSSLTLNDAGDLGVRAVVEGNRVKFMPVEVVRDTTEGIWVSGLPPVVDVIVVGQEYVVDGVEVVPVYRELSQ